MFSIYYNIGTFYFLDHCIKTYMIKNNKNYYLHTQKIKYIYKLETVSTAVLPSFLVLCGSWVKGGVSQGHQFGQASQEVMTSYFLSVAFF